MSTFPPVPNLPQPAHQGGLTATARLDRRRIHHRGNSVRHLVVTVQAPTAAAAAAPLPMNLALVLDASGSMSGPPLAAAVAAALSVVERLGPSDHLSLVSFACDVVVHHEAVRMDAAGQALLRGSLQALHTRGSTDLAAGWLAGCEAVARRAATAQDAARGHVLVLSDGRANHGIVDPSQLAAIASDLRQRAVTTSTVGIGDGYEPVHLQTLAEAGGGRMHDAERTTDLAAVLLGEVGAARTTTVENLVVHLDLPEGVQARVYGTAPLSGSAREVRVVLGAMASGGQRTLVLPLHFPARRDHDELLLGVRLRWQAPGAQDVRELVLPPCTALFATGEAVRLEARDPALAAVVLQHWHDHAVHTAMAQNQAGAGQAAADGLGRELHWFERYSQFVPGGAELVASLQRLQQTVHRRHAPRAAKEALLASYKRSRGERDLRTGRPEPGQFGAW
jgi:Ca-activated chloride channel family protein